VSHSLSKGRLECVPCSLRDAVRLVVRTGLLPLTLAVSLGVVGGARAAEPPAREGRDTAKMGSLVIVGGGWLPDAVQECFLALAGGEKARLVVIPTASSLADNLRTLGSYAYWTAAAQRKKIKSVVFLHTRNQVQANDPAFVKPLTEATGVWLGGGDQSRLIAAYKGTAVERELHRLLTRGGVIGGTSAGASAMSTLMITGGNPVARLGTGFGLLADVVIDQHFMQRNRLARLLGIVTSHPRVLGLGIDEQTAVVIHGGSLTVMGKANVRLCLPGNSGQKPDIKVYKAGDQCNLDAFIHTTTARAETPSDSRREPTSETMNGMPTVMGNR
jgi:cyanophycinase